MRISNVICLDDNGILSSPRTVKSTKNSSFWKRIWLPGHVCVSASSTMSGILLCL
jgi:hypothetical protein